MALDSITLQLMRLVAESRHSRDELKGQLSALASDIDTLIGALDDEAPPPHLLPTSPASAAA